MSIRKPNGANLNRTMSHVAPGELLAMNWEDDYFLVTTAGVVRKAAQVWADQTGNPLSTFADWFMSLGDTAPVVVRKYNGFGVWDVKPV